jgi:hypothetical protein
MSTMATTFVGSDIWNAEVYGTLSVTARTCAAVKDTHHQLKTRWFYMRMNRHLESFLDNFYAVFEKAQSGTLVHAQEPATPDQIRKSLDSLWNLHHCLQGLYDLSVRKGLKRKVLLASQVEILGRSKERLLDVIQWVEEMSNPEEVHALDVLFASAAEELEQGETVTVP